MESGRPAASDRARRIATALAAASSFRFAASLTDPGRRVDAVWDGLGRLSRATRGTTAVVDRLLDDGCGDAGVPEPRVLLASAQELEDTVATEWGMSGGSGQDPGRVRTTALRADRPTTRERTRRRHRRRPRARGRRVP
ncbi:MAG: hypothetical protein JWO14_3565 [Solirubrobacterales bacterium]|nr:hypothetical protein [Solirubrobacterales bacterium]